MSTASGAGVVRENSAKPPTVPTRLRHGLRNRYQPNSAGCSLIQALRSPTPRHARFPFLVTCPNRSTRSRRPRTRISAASCRRGERFTGTGGTLERIQPDNRSIGAARMRGLLLSKQNAPEPWHETGRQLAKPPRHAAQASHSRSQPTARIRCLVLHMVLLGSRSSAARSMCRSRLVLFFQRAKCSASVIGTPFGGWFS